MNADVYFFSGTGNSLAVARDLAARLGGTLRSIANVMDQPTFDANAEATNVGLVFPVYHKSLPLIVKRFIERFERLDGAYLFAVATYGDTPGLALQHLADLVEARGSRLAAGFGVHLPYNYLTPTPTLSDFFDAFTLRDVPLEKQQMLINEAPDRIEEIAAYVSARKVGHVEVTSDPITRLADRLGLPETLGKWAWLKVAGAEDVPDVSFIESRQWMDHAFRADERCIACGICADVCPVQNIRVVNDRPTWQHRCEQCFACLHWCPQAAIQFGAATGGKPRYHHPDVTLAEMLRAAPREKSSD
jgi:ferredoxin/flavodoxin